MVEQQNVCLLRRPISCKVTLLNLQPKHAPQVSNYVLRQSASSKANLSWSRERGTDNASTDFWQRPATECVFWQLDDSPARWLTITSSRPFRVTSYIQLGSIAIVWCMHDLNKYIGGGRGHSSKQTSEDRIPSLLDATSSCTSRHQMKGLMRT